MVGRTSGEHVNFTVEPLVRQAYAAAVARDVDASAAALEAMGDQAKDCVVLAVVIAIHLVGPVDVPEDEEYLLELAGEFGDMEAEWAGITTDDALLFLRGITGQGGLRDLEQATFIRVPFVLGAWLLSAFGPAEQDWTERLDEVLQKIKAGG
jgi:hypothetical protein